MLVHGQGNGVTPKAFLRDKALGGVDQFLQVFNAVLAFAFALVMRDEA